MPIRPAQYYSTNWWGGIGVNMNIPIFNGFLYSAQAKEASIRAQAASEQAATCEIGIVRDVRTSWLAANTAFQRVSVTAELLKQANLALTLAQTRYQMGLSSIVELSQAQYQQTDAAIGNTNAQYQYRLRLRRSTIRQARFHDRSLQFEMFQVVARVLTIEDLRRAAFAQPLVTPQARLPQSTSTGVALFDRIESELAAFGASSIIVDPLFGRAEWQKEPNNQIPEMIQP